MNSHETILRPRREALSWDEKLLIFGFPTLLLIAALGQFSLGRGQSSAQIKFPAPVAMPNPNGFDAYLAAEVTIKLDTPAVDPINDSKKLTPTDPKLRAQKYSLANKTRWLQANAAGFAMFRAAQTLTCRHPEFAPGGFGGFSYPLHNRLRQLARYKIIEINAFKMRGNWNGVVTSALDTIQMGNDIAIGGTLQAKRTGDGIQSVARETLTAPLDPISKLGAKDARAAVKRLEAILGRRFPYAQSLENERWAMLREFDFLTQRPNWQSSFSANQGKEPTWREKLAIFSNPRQQILEDINRTFDRNVADMKLPFSAPFSQLQPLHPLLQNFAWSQSSRHEEARELVSLNMLLLRLALRAFEAENGRFPRQLSELSPRFLQKIPVDTFADNAPFHFLWTGKKYRLYSVGPDGKDDKGAPMKEKYVSYGRGSRYNTTLDAGNPGDYVAGINH